ncbi:hypothetical protein F2Q70_00029785 [Brassica cretica]|uniref:Uncharacterized protein n=2 Tax=Brassica cretica TaxID=69181 RepID=A0A3N6Q222_BRACR|nr:hypothetical protein F2Q70_00029785 [Brassica cretica]KAF2553315.1 hypothetical protein F2Q68_00034252 [Brassica cretica]KAF3591007.1 hypothetical protein DY000_02021905 [Brassica cretica]
MLECIFSKKKGKKEVIDDAVKAIEKVIESCETEEIRLSDEVKTNKGNITTLGDEDPDDT